MARKPQPKPPSPPEVTPVVSPTLFSFAKLIVPRLSFHELPKVSTAEGEAINPNVESSVSITYGLNDEGNHAEVRLGMVFKPDPRDKPYHIEVEVIGQFGVKSGPTGAPLDAFCRNNAPVILFPYIRELVHRLTQDGRYGPVRLDPINIPSMIRPDDWKPAIPPISSPSVLPQPSSQSASASKDSAKQP